MRKAQNPWMGLVSGVAVLTLLLSAGAARATVIFNGSNASGIEDLDVDGTFYDVVFHR